MSLQRREETAPNAISTLSKRERQLLQLAAQGYTDQGIAHRLGISLATVGTYWGRIRIKIGPLNRTELVAVYLRDEASKTIARLKEENDRLIHQVSEHARTSTMLKASLELFRGLVETAPDAIVLVNKDGVIELANEEAEHLFGYGKDELVGLVVDALVPARFRGDHEAHRSDYNANPVRRKMGEHIATVAVKKDGTEFPMAAALSPTTTPGGILVTCIVRDLTHQLEAGFGPFKPE